MVSKTRWGTEYSHLSKECQELVNKFFMVQQALSQELLEAKPLGICKTSIFGTNELNSKSPILTLTNGKNSTTLDMFGRKGSREIF